MESEALFGMTVGIIAIIAIFVVLPWMILNFLAKWRRANGLNADDERMLEDLWRSAREMERRIETLERLINEEGRNTSRREDDYRPRRHDS